MSGFPQRNITYARRNWIYVRTANLLAMLKKPMIFAKLLPTA